MTLQELANLAQGRSHLAIFTEPFLSWLLEGKKTVESRWMKNQIVPYMNLRMGDLVYVKKSGGPVVASFRVGWVKEGPLRSDMVALVREHKEKICLNDIFIEDQLHTKKRVVLMEVTDLQRLGPWNVEKRGMAGWVVLPSSAPTPSDLRQVGISGF